MYSKKDRFKIEHLSHIVVINQNISSPTIKRPYMRTKKLKESLNMHIYYYITIY